MVDEDRTVEVAPERLAGWLDRFIAAHGDPTITALPDRLRLTSPDGAIAELVNRWGGQCPQTLEGFLAGQLAARRVGVLLARKAAHSVGVADGPTLLAHRTDTHYVQGRTKKGGWSQQRYARRRDNQATKAYADAADDAVEVVLPFVGSLDAVVCGGDSGAIGAILADQRLAALGGLLTAHGVLPVPDPRLAVLTDFIAAYRAVPVRLNADARRRG